MAEDTTQVTKFRNPGFGRRKTVPFNKGRQLDPQAVDDITELLGDRPRSRDLLIEHLHLIQDKYGHLSAAHMNALASDMNMAQAEVYEVASFYAHFDLVLEGDTAPPPMTIRVCDSLSCEMAGAQDLLKNLPDAVGENVRVIRAPCMGRCHVAPVAEVGHYHATNATVESISEAVSTGHTHAEIPDYIGYEDYIAGGGYALLKDCLSGKRTFEEMADLIEESGLRGLGGAGFPTGRKWKIVRGTPGPRLMTINGDEGEPGTIKDHHYLTRDPHRFIEGALIGAWAVEAEEIYIYMRDEYPDVLHLLAKEMDRAVAEGLADHTKLILRRGAGAYICGEESAMIESIEGKRGLPRHRPPYVAQVGIFGKPTLVNNVETVFWVREIVEKGADWFKGHGRNGRTGLRSFSVSGRVKEPGVKLAPAGITMNDLIAEYCGGMADGHDFKAYLPGGASGGILPASKADIPMDFDTIQKEANNAFIGSAAVIVLSDKDSVIDAALNIMRFFEDESCGQCTPCRVGTEKAVKLMVKDSWDKPLLEELAKTMMDASICGLGQAAPNPLLCVLEYFPDEVPG